MPNPSARSRIVVFRLTEDEYRTLLAACVSKRGRNLSEFTRTELLAAVGSHNIAGMIEDRFRALEDEILPLRISLAKLTDMLATALAANPVDVRRSQAE